MLLVGVFALANRPAWRFTQISVALGLLGICVLLVPVSHASWSLREYESKVHAAFVDLARL